MHGITDEMVATQLKEAVDRLMKLTTYIELKWYGRAAIGRREYWYGACDAFIDDKRVCMEVDGPELSIILHGMIQELEQGAPNADDNTGYVYLSF